MHPRIVHRRLLLAGFAVTATAAVPAFAQTAPSGSTTLPAGQGAASAAQSSMPMMGAAETTMATQTLQVGSLSLMLSRLAEKKAEHPQVKQFAMFETAEQETVANIIKSMRDPTTLSGAVVPPTDAEVAEHLDAAGKQMVEKMTAAKGHAFDTDYVRAQTEGHQKLQKIQATYLQSGRNPEAVAVAKLASGMIKEHLALLSNIDRQLGQKG